MKAQDNEDIDFLVNVECVGIEPKKRVNTSMASFAQMIGDKSLPPEDSVISIQTDESCRKVFQLLGKDDKLIKYSEFTHYSQNTVPTKYERVMSFYNYNYYLFSILCKNFGTALLSCGLDTIQD